MTKENKKVEQVQEPTVEQIVEMLGGTLSKISLPLQQHQVLQGGLKKLSDLAKLGEEKNGSKEK